MEIRPVTYSPSDATNATEKAEAPATLPEEVAKPATITATESAIRQPNRSAEMEQTKQAVQDIERMMKLFSKNLEFSYDPGDHRAVMRIVDQQTREVIRQVPTKEALEIAKALEKIQDMLLMQGAKPLGGR